MQFGYGQGNSDRFISTQFVERGGKLGAIELFSRGLLAAGRFAGAPLVSLDRGFLDMASPAEGAAAAGRFSCLGLIDIGSADAFVVSLTRPGIVVG